MLVKTLLPSHISSLIGYRGRRPPSVANVPNPAWPGFAREILLSVKLGLSENKAGAADAALSALGAVATLHITGQATSEQVFAACVLHSLACVAVNDEAGAKQSYARAEALFKKFSGEIDVVEAIETLGLVSYQVKVLSDRLAGYERCL